MLRRRHSGRKGARNGWSGFANPMWSRGAVCHAATFMLRIWHPQSHAALVAPRDLICETSQGFGLPHLVVELERESPSTTKWLLACCFAVAVLSAAQASLAHALRQPAWCTAMMWTVQSCCSACFPIFVFRSPFLKLNSFSNPQQNH